MPCPHVRTVPTGHSFHPERDWLARFAPVDLWISISLSLALMAQERLTTNRHGLLWAAPLEAALPLFGSEIGSTNVLPTFPSIALRQHAPGWAASVKNGFPSVFHRICLLPSPQGSVGFGLREVVVHACSLSG
ncbi:putative NSFL1 cofactor p47 [Anopheles sinensis]|uniref:Putative NSFL1 cofactor p47 n=1 Tax=Anopheles sinensis TaxID=74873 RepID=A0A084W4X9_ANOSI|nr:putative NSFL1 cofactor p47 [Anopheles sinensis]